MHPFGKTASVQIELGILVEFLTFFGTGYYEVATAPVFAIPLCRFVAVYPSIFFVGFYFGPPFIPPTRS
jgi:hypothetical protein